MGLRCASDGKSLCNTKWSKKCNRGIPFIFFGRFCHVLFLHNWHVETELLLESVVSRCPSMPTWGYGIYAAWPSMFLCQYATTPSICLFNDASIELYNWLIVCVSCHVGEILHQNKILTSHTKIWFVRLPDPQRLTRAFFGRHPASFELQTEGLLAWSIVPILQYKIRPSVQLGHTVATWEKLLGNVMGI